MKASLRILHAPRPSRITATLAARLSEPVIERSAVQEVLDRYGLRRLGRFRNLRLARRSRNVVVRTDAGTKFVKLYRPQWTEATVRNCHSILVRLEALGFPAVRLTRAPDGATWTGLDGQILAVFDLVSGRNYSLNYLIRNDRLRLTAIAGRTLARLHATLDGFLPEGEHHLGFPSRTGPPRRDAAWHAATLDELVPRSVEIADPAARDLARRLVERAPPLLDAIQRFGRALVSADLPRLVIHGDYGLHNLLFQPPDVAVPVDFELSRLDLRLNDLISVLGKHRYEGGRYDLESMEVFLRAYAGAFPLTAEERDLLVDAWCLYKRQAAVQYWNSYFETGGPTRKLASALDSIGQAELVERHPDVIRRLADGAGRPAMTRNGPGPW